EKIFTDYITNNLLLLKNGKNVTPRNGNRISLLELFRSDTITKTGSFPPTKVVYYTFNRQH
ncbi:MAG: hypothetical protein LBE12_03470, partial [Planctomycetaceae bacterium]|nr:hypothetical protein [Planctomycetaceae bacterium]